MSHFEYGLSGQEHSSLRGGENLSGNIITEPALSRTFELSGRMTPRVSPLWVEISHSLAGPAVSTAS